MEEMVITGYEVVEYNPPKHGCKYGIEFTITGGKFGNKMTQGINGKGMTLQDVVNQAEKSVKHNEVYF